MIVVNPAPYSIPLNSANVPTESVATQNKVAVRIPESVSTYESSKNAGPEVDKKLNDAERAEKNAALREKILGSKEGKPQQQQADDKTTASHNESTENKQQAIKDHAIIRNLAAIDRRVKAHEQAHSSVGGVYAGSPSFTYKTGPNGVRYAVAGEVPIDLSGVPGNPQATLRKSEQVARAALAPADPSSVDRRIASSAQALATKARFEISRLSAERLKNQHQENVARINGEEVEESEDFVSNTSLAGSKLRAALATDATEQVGGQVSASA
jgi:hypothetical protein